MSYRNRRKNLSLTFLNHPTAHSRDSMCPKKKTNRPISYPNAKIFVMLDKKNLFGFPPIGSSSYSDKLMLLKWQKLKVNSYRIFSRHLNLRADNMCILCLDKENIKLSIWYILVEVKYEIIVNLLGDLTENFCYF